METANANDNAQGSGGGGLWADIVAEVASADAAAAADALSAATPLGLYIEDYAGLEADVFRITRADLIDGALAGKDRSRAFVHVYAPPGDSAAALAEDVRARLEAAGVRASVVSGGVREEDWANNWKQFFKPFRVGERIVVRPAWEGLAGFPLVPGDIVLAVDPGMAFGTGSHASTRQCLEMLERRAGGAGQSLGGTGQNPIEMGQRADGASLIARVLDVGTGSGILAVASLLMGAQKALAVDIDGYALKNARANAELNGVADRIEFRVGDLAAGVAGEYDLVFANIVADSVIELLRDAARLLAPGGAAIVSGIIEEREGDVRKAAASNGFTVEHTLREPPWVSLMLMSL